MERRLTSTAHEQLLPATKQLIREVEERTGRLIEIQPEPGIRGRGRAVYVVTDQDPRRHLIVYAPVERLLLDHLVAHQCGHILRFAEAEPIERVVPVMTEPRIEMATRQLASELQPLLNTVWTPTESREALTGWFGATIAGLTDSPSDVRVERWIRREYPYLREVQTRSLLQQAYSLNKTLGRSVEKATPPTIWRASVATNYAFVKSTAQLLDRRDLVDEYRFSSLRGLGEELLAIVDSEGDAGLAGDHRISNLWAAALGLSGWFEWRHLADVPANYWYAFE